MKKKSFIHFFLLAGGIFSLGFFSMPALAEDAGNVQELLRVIDAQQQQIESQQKQLDEQRQLLKDLQTQVGHADLVEVGKNKGHAHRRAVEVPVRGVHFPVEILQGVSDFQEVIGHGATSLSNSGGGGASSSRSSPVRGCRQTIFQA